MAKVAETTPEQEDAARKLLDAVRDYARAMGLYPNSPGRFTYDVELTADLRRGTFNVQRWPKRKPRRQTDLDGITSSDSSWVLTVREMLRRPFLPRWRR